MPTTPEKRIKILAQIIERIFAPRLITRIHDVFWRRVIFNWRRAFLRLLPLGGASFGNVVTIFNEGDKAFGSMREAIGQAQKLVWLETYIYENDAIGRMIRDDLVAAAKRGCEVVVIYDYFGSGWLSNSFFSDLRRAGGQVFPFSPIWPWRRKGPFIFRDHRKILVVDHKIGFSGGMNIGADYAGKVLGHGRFRDTTIRIDGPGVKDLANLFLDTWRETTGEDRPLETTSRAREDGVFVQVLGSNQRRSLLAIQKSMQVVVKRATQYCYLTTPYFIPYDRLRKSLLNAAERGVDVRILTAGLSDIPLMNLASRGIYGQFLKAGIRIYEMFGQSLHAKTATIDGVYSCVGSFNLDHWSARRNLEVNVSVFDQGIAAQLESQFEEDLKSAKEVTLQSWQNRSLIRRLFQWIAYQLMRL